MKLLANRFDRCVGWRPAEMEDVLSHFRLHLRVYSKNSISFSSEAKTNNSFMLIRFPSKEFLQSINRVYCTYL